ncbi:S-methyl-5'-thioinosine phosphorylase [Oxobacter pfennigii]|uniref:Probable 6-oxopurine nucleoside phosphorylase n=1 Tax=Oxobacter pfennigii TaxID=36849 RepID=A0A0P8X0B3_9CLOT|nr:S-methyl-5'-thioadenosine phosphorylase [Oxobacter pfennigii]KPU44191.1 S-methyl-5'-thioinosine phosphorylase [Oxobacter pfennigii]
MNSKIAIIGGTGIYHGDIFSDMEDIKADTPYGIVYLKSARYKTKDILFLERHGKGHALAPHEVNYRANIWALHSLGAKRVIATAAVGAINTEFQVGSFALVDDFIDFTKGRKSTYFEETNEGIVHIDMSAPYCPDTRKYIIKAASNENIKIRNGGIYICTEGPRFETKAEIRAYAKMGADMVGMTNVPEVILAREKGLCYAAIALITNYAAGVSKTPLTHKEVIDNMNLMSGNLKKLMASLLESLPEESECTCRFAAKEQGSLQ